MKNFLKYRKLFFSCLVVGSALMVSCTKEPQANFSYSPEQLFTNEAANFKNTSKDASHYKWFFYSNNYSEEKDPSIIFDKAGTYNVVLIAYSKNKTKFNTTYKTIKVKNKIDLNILTSTKWQFSNIKTSSMNESYDGNYYNYSSPYCMTDDIWSFKSDGTFSIDNSSRHCDANELSIRTGNWTFDNTKNLLSTNIQNNTNASVSESGLWEIQEANSYNLVMFFTDGNIKTTYYFYADY